MAKKNGKKNGSPKAAGKVGTYTVSAAIPNGPEVKDVEVNVTVDTIAAVRKAIPALTLPPYTNKKGQNITPKGAHTTFSVIVDGQKVRFGNVLLAIAGTTEMLPKGSNGENPEALKGNQRKLVMRLIGAALEAAGVAVVRPSSFGAMFYLPENAPEGSGGGNEQSGADALAAILAA